MRFAVVGVGTMGRHHARVVAESDRARAVRVIDPERDAGSEIAERYGADWSPELADLSGGIDAVILAAPTGLHHEARRLRARERVPLLVEKPVVDSLAGTEEILALSEARQVPLMCGLLERYNPAVVTASSILDGPLHITATRHSPVRPAHPRPGSCGTSCPRRRPGDRLMGGPPTAVDARRGSSIRGLIRGRRHHGGDPRSSTASRIAQISASRIGQHKVRALSIYEADR